MTLPGREGMESDRPSDIPAVLAERVAGYCWTAKTLGCSHAAVFQLDAPARPTLFIKSEPAGPLSELVQEAARLRWLEAQQVPCPSVLIEARAPERDWILLSAVPGRDLASSPELEPRQIVEIMADALRALHGLDAATCPFDRRLDVTIARARANMEAGLVDEEDMDEERTGRTARQVFEELLARRPGAEDLVVTHGDACPPNLLADAGRFTGFIDCARLGVADRHQDLALACRSLESDFGKQWVEPFLRRYGFAADPQRLDYYRLLDEFF